MEGGFWFRQQVFVWEKEVWEEPNSNTELVHRVCAETNFILQKFLSYSTFSLLVLVRAYIPAMLEVVNKRLGRGGEEGTKWIKHQAQAA